jgi:hypothetical protein
MSLMGEASVALVVSPTDAEKQLLAQMAVLKMATKAGNKTARKELQTVAWKVLRLRQKAASGDPRAKHLVTVLRDSKIFALKG